MVLRISERIFLLNVTFNNWDWIGFVTSSCLYWFIIIYLFLVSLSPPVEIPTVPSSLVLALEVAGRIGFRVSSVGDSPSLELLIGCQHWTMEIRDIQYSVRSTYIIIIIIISIYVRELNILKYCCDLPANMTVMVVLVLSTMWLILAIIISNFCRRWLH